MLPENYYNSSVNLVKLQDAKLIHRNLLLFYVLTMKDQKLKLRKQFYLSSYQKEMGGGGNHLGINLPKEATDMYSENFKTDERN